MGTGRAAFLGLVKRGRDHPRPLEVDSALEPGPAQPLTAWLAQSDQTVSCTKAIATRPPNKEAQIESLPLSRQSVPLRVRQGGETNGNHELPRSNSYRRNRPPLTTYLRRCESAERAKADDVLSIEDNEVLCRARPGIPVGELSPQY